MEDPNAQQQEVAGDSAKPEKLLYHYTDQTGLDGILSSGCMWATHFKFLNDSSEREHGFSVFSKAIDDIYTDPINTLGISRINLDNFRSALKQTLRNYFEATSSFVLSFTTDSPDEIKKKIRQ